jgi:putative tryptophan/tyrosine transport system substrate-binding protein
MLLPSGQILEEPHQGEPDTTTNRKNERDRLGPRSGVRMRRRELLLALTAGMIGARAGRTQQKAMPVIGYLSSTSPGSNASWVEAFRQGLRENGYIEGQNVVIDYRWAEGDYNRLPALAAALVDRKVEVIMTQGGIPPARAAKDATSTIPIVFVGGDPISAGLVASLARPGGNLTGIVFMTAEMTPKRIELLAELVPRAGAIALLVNTNNPMPEPVMRDVQDAARAKGLRLQVLQAAAESEIDAAFASLVQLRVGGLVLGPDPFFNSRREQLITLAARHAIPVIYDFPEYPAAGGLISYGPKVTTASRLAGIYAGKILEGARPADLPVQQPTTFELVVNLKTAKALGLTVPPAILARADEVIE